MIITMSGAVSLSGGAGSFFFSRGIFIKESAASAVGGRIVDVKSSHSPTARRLNPHGSMRP